METNMIIKLGDEHQVQAKKKGVVRLGGVDIKAFVVPEFRISLLSVGQLDLYGYTATFRSGICSITNTNGRKVLSAIRKQGLYILSMDGSAHVSEIRSLRSVRHANMVDLWHQRFAHLNYQDLLQILETLDKRVGADPSDKRVGTDPSDKHVGTDPSDKRIGTDPSDKSIGTDPSGKHVGTDPSDEHIVDPTDQPMTDPSDEHSTDPTDEPVMGPSDTRHRTSWKTPDLCQTCVHTKQQQHVIRTQGIQDLNAIRACALGSLWAYKAQYWRCPILHRLH